MLLEGFQSRAKGLMGSSVSGSGLSVPDTYMEGAVS